MGEDATAGTSWRNDPTPPMMDYSTGEMMQVSIQKKLKTFDADLLNFTKLSSAKLVELFGQEALKD